MIRRGGSLRGGLGLIDTGTNSDGSMSSGKLSGICVTWSGGAVTGDNVGGSGMITVDPPVPEGLGLGINTGEGDLLLMILLQPLRSV